jgi:two-component system response regulator MtrA
MPTSGRGLVLVVEDEPAIADVLRRYLEREQYSVRLETDGLAGLEAARSSAAAAIVLDVGLPGMDGIEICRRLRAESNWTPILFATARDDEVDRILGLELGADDYITKPFSPREVVARVTAVLRRGAAAEAPDVLRVGQVSLDLGARRTQVGDTEVSLTATEFDLLAHLMRKPRRVFSREQLLQDVWGYASAAGPRTVDVHIAQLRAKLGDAGCVRTVRGVGYSAEPPRGG